MPRPIFAASGLTVTEKVGQHGPRLVVDDGRQQELEGKGAPELDTRETRELYASLRDWLRLVPGGLDG